MSYSSKETIEDEGEWTIVGGPKPKKSGNKGQGNQTPPASTTPSTTPTASASTSTPPTPSAATGTATKDVKAKRFVNWATRVTMQKEQPTFFRDGTELNMEKVKAKAAQFADQTSKCWAATKGNGKRAPT